MSDATLPLAGTAALVTGGGSGIGLGCAQRLLQAHQSIHAALRDALLEREELVGEEILDVIRAAILHDELAEIDLRQGATEDDPARQAPR